MSTKKYAFVQNIFDALIAEWSVKGYKGLSEHIGVPYQTLMAWKKRGSIGDFAPFMDKGISKAWLETGEGNMRVQVASYTSSGSATLSGTTIAEAETHLHPNPDNMTMAQKMAWMGFGMKDIRQMQEWLKLSEEEQDDELKKLCSQNIEKGRY